MSLQLFLRSTVVGAALAAGVIGCAANPVTGRPDLVFQSQAGEIERAKQVHPLLMQQFGGAYENPRLQAYVNEVGQRVAKASHRPDLEYTFVVLDSPDTNAFTPGGGYVYITRGILNYLNSEAELAAVLGHEIGHITARHPVRSQSRAALNNIGALAVGLFTGSGDLAGLASYAGAALISGYGRDQELEADRLGAQYLAEVGYVPDRMIDVVRLLKNQELYELQRAREEKRQARVYHGVFATHPDNDQRLREVVKAAAKTTSGSAPARDDGRERYLRAIEGLPLMHSPAQGVLKANRFYHAGYGLTLAFPSGWQVENLADRLVAVSPQKDAMLQLQPMAPPPNTDPAQFLSRYLARANPGLVEPIEINGLPGYTAVARSATAFGQVPVRYAVVYLNNLAYVFAGASRLGDRAPVADPLFMSSIKTFRRLRSNELADAEPYRIQIIQAGEGTTIAELARRSPLPRYAAEQLRLLNDLYPAREPTPGQYLKIVE